MAETKTDLSKTINHPIDQAIKSDDISKTMAAGKRTETVLPANQIPISLDKYENNLIKKRKYQE